MEERNQREGSILFRGKTYSSMAIRKASIAVRKSLEGIKGNVGIITENPAFILAAMLGIQQANCESFELNPLNGILYNQILKEKYSLSTIVTDEKRDLEGIIVLDESIWKEPILVGEVTEPYISLIRENSVKASPIHLTTEEGENFIQFLEDILKRDLQHTIYIHEETELWNPFLLEAVLKKDICVEVLETKRDEVDTFTKLGEKRYTCLYMSFAQFYAWKYAIITEKNIKGTLHDVITYGNENYDVCSIKEYFNHQGIKWYHFMGNGQFIAVSAIRKEDNGELYHLAKEIKNLKIRIMNRAKKDMPVGVPGTVFVCQEEMAQTEFTGKRLKNGRIKITGWNGDCCYHNGRFCSLHYVEEQIKRNFPITKLKIQWVKDKIVLFYAAQSEIEDSEQKAFIEKCIPAFYPVIEWNATTEEILKQTTFQNLLRKRKRNYGKEPLVLTEKQKEIADLWKRILGCEDLGVDDNFFDAGGNSALFVQMLAEAAEKMNRELPMMKLMEHATLRSFFEFLDQNIVVEDITLEEAVEQDIETEPYLTNMKEAKKASEICQNILLTGANGFLGCFLLKELLEQSNATIYCLIRGKEEKDAYQKLFDAMCYYKLDGYLDYERIRLVIGDLGEEQFGLEEECYHVLCEEIDMVVHSGAVVNFVYNYEMLRNENVAGTGRILGFASTKKIKPVHFISSIAIFGVGAKSTEVDEDFPLNINELPRSGYNQTKWAADVLVSNARKAGLPCSIYRVGNICGDSVNGVCQTRDFIWMLFKVGIEIHTFAEYYRLPFAMTPVDCVANSVIRLALHGNSSENYHVMSQHSVIYQQLLEWVRSFGYQFDIVGFEDWVEMVRKYTRTLGDAKFQSIPAVIGVKEDVADDFQFIRYNNTKTFEKVKELGGEIIPLNENIFHKHLTCFRESGFIQEKE